MDRIIVLACLVGVAYSKICPNYANGNAGAAWTSTFQVASFNIGQEIVDIDEKIQKFCQYYSNYEMRQIYGSDYYQLSIVLPNFDEDTIQVRIMHRLLLVSATSCGSNYADVKLLPDVLDNRRAAWKYYNGELFIMFPYKVHPSTPVQKHCTWWIDPSKITVPKMTSGSDGNCFGFCKRSFGDGILRDNVWHASGVPSPPNSFSSMGTGHGANGYAGDTFGQNGGGGGWGGGASQGSGFGSGGHGYIGNGVFGRKK